LFIPRRIAVYRVLTVHPPGRRQLGASDGLSSRTLAARVADRDRLRFVGREPELAFLERCLDDPPAASVVLIHGPGGIGKSMLLRELARRATERGYEQFFVEGRDLPPMPDALEAVLSGARRCEQPLVLIDTYERMTALDGYLRRGLLPSLPERTIVMIAGRRAPDPAWFAGGWEGVARELPLGELAPAEALRLLALGGLYDARADAVVRWAEGSPLALALAAETATVDDDWSPEVGLERPELLRLLLRRLADSELGRVKLSALGVAAISRVTTVGLLRAVLPNADAEAEYAALQALTFVEPLGDGITLHELVRRALHADLHRREGELERELRRRIVDHLYERAQRGETLMAIDMAHLIENEAIRWGFGWEGSVAYRIDEVRRGDAEQVAAHLAQRGYRDYWELTKVFFEQAPEHVAVARDTDDRLCGYTIVMTPADAPAIAELDPVLAPRLAHARAETQLGDAVLWRDSADFTGDPRGRVQAMLGMTGILRSGAANPRFAYLPINPTRPGAPRFAQTLGAAHLTELDCVIGRQQIQCHRIDYGPGGLFAAQRAVVYAELGLAPPAPAPGLAAASPPPDAEAVREALRRFRVPRDLARSPMATGSTQDERAESVRRRVRIAVERAFGDSENEKLLQRVLIRGYIEPAVSHEQTAIDLSLSRAAYFRRLRSAAERVAEYLAQSS
jgi:hypothetical protein